MHKGARSRWQNSMEPADWGAPEGGEMDEQIGGERATAEIDKERWMNGGLYVIWPLIKWCSDIERCWNGVMVDRWGDTGGEGVWVWAWLSPALRQPPTAVCSSSWCQRFFSLSLLSPLHLSFLYKLEPNSHTGWSISQISWNDLTYPSYKETIASVGKGEGQSNGVTESINKSTLKVIGWTLSVTFKVNQSDFFYCK